MLEVVKLTVTKLQRIKVGGLALGALKPGFWRVLQPDDLRVLLGNTWEETRVIAPGASADDVEDNE
jgi:16S rRNA U516 pseudouridylate synthase RsuA-like enzyme